MSLGAGAGGMQDGSDGARMAGWLGWSGLLPFALLAVAVMAGPWRDAALSAFLAYSAVILSFLGGVRWGRAMAQGASSRQLAWAVTPSLVAWPALMLPAPAALGVLAAAYVVVAALDGRLDRLPAPDWYPLLRVRLSAAVVGLHLLVLVAGAA